MENADNGLGGVGGLAVGFFLLDGLFGQGKELQFLAIEGTTKPTAQTLRHFRYLSQFERFGGTTEHAYTRVDAEKGQKVAWRPVFFQLIGQLWIFRRHPISRLTPPPEFLGH